MHICIYFSCKTNYVSTVCQLLFIAYLKQRKQATNWCLLSFCNVISIFQMNLRIGGATIQLVATNSITMSKWTKFFFFNNLISLVSHRQFNQVRGWCNAVKMVVKYLTFLVLSHFVTLSPCSFQNPDLGYDNFLFVLFLSRYCALFMWKRPCGRRHDFSVVRGFDGDVNYKGLQRSVCIYRKQTRYFGQGVFWVVNCTHQLCRCLLSVLKPLA